jgi:hypothetical protein
MRSGFDKPRETVRTARCQTDQDFIFNDQNDLLAGRCASRMAGLLHWPIIAEITGLRSTCDSRGQNHIDFGAIIANLPS